MSFNQLPTDIIAQIYEYIDLLYIWHFHLSSAAFAVSSEYPELGKAAEFIITAEIVSLNQIRKLKPLIAKYPNYIIYDVNVESLKRELGCKCDHIMFDGYWSEIFFCKILLGCTLEHIYNHAIIFIHHGFGNRNKSLGRYLLKLFVHYANDIPDELKQTDEYIIRAYCRSGHKVIKLGTKQFDDYSHLQTHI